MKKHGGARLRRALIQSARPRKTLRPVPVFANTKPACPKRQTDIKCAAEEVCDEGEMNDEDFAVQVKQRLMGDPTIRELWRTAADSCEANEIIRQFKLWVITLKPLQSKVAQLILKHMGDIDAHIWEEAFPLGYTNLVVTIFAFEKESNGQMGFKRFSN